MSSINQTRFDTRLRMIAAMQSFKPHLSPRLIQIRDELLEKKSDKEIALKFGLAVGTVKTHVSRLLALYRINQPRPTAEEKEEL